MEYSQFGDTEVSQADLPEKYKQMIRRPSTETGSGKGISPMEEEFKKLSEVVEDGKPITIAITEKNCNKNRSNQLVPFDQNRVILSPVFNRPDETYINASFIQVSNCRTLVQ
jgi:protein-tyrosine phosphatase